VVWLAPILGFSCLYDCTGYWRIPAKIWLSFLMQLGG